MNPGAWFGATYRRRKRSGLSEEALKAIEKETNQFMWILFSCMFGLPLIVFLFWFVFGS